MCRTGITLLVCLLLTFAALPASAQPPKARTDEAGDPLPPGALVRMGTIRWRVGSVFRTTIASNSALSPDGRFVYIGDDRGIRVFDLETGLVTRTLKGPEGGARVLALSSDGKLLACGGYEGASLWDAQSGKQLRPLKVSAVAVMTFTRDGKKLITGGEDHERSVRVFDVARGKEELRLLWHQRRVGFVGCAPDNKTLVTGSWDDDVRITDLSTGELIDTFREKHANDTVVALSPDGKTLAVYNARYDLKQRRWLHVLQLIDVASGKERATAQEAKGRIVRLVFSPDGTSLVAWGENQCQVYEAATGKAIRELPAVQASYFTPDGRYLVGTGSIIRVWDFENGKELHPPEGPLGATDSLAFSPRGDTLASCSFSDHEESLVGLQRGVIRLWGTANGRLKSTLRGHESYVRAVQFAPDGRLVSGGGDSTLRVWDVAAAKEVSQFKLHAPGAAEKPLQVATMRVAKDGRTLAAAALGLEGPLGKRTVHLFGWDFASGKVIARREHSGFSSDWPGFSADAKAFVARDGKDLFLKDLVSGKQIVKLQPAPQPGGEGVLNADILEQPFTFSPDGRVMAARGSRQRNEGVRYWRDHYAIVLFDLSTGKEMYRLPVDNWLAQAAFSPDSKYLAGADGLVVRIWDVPTGKRLWESPALDARVTALAFNPDGDRLATALGNITMLLWDVSSSK